MRFENHLFLKNFPKEELKNYSQIIKTKLEDKLEHKTDDDQLVEQKIAVIEYKKAYQSVSKVSNVRIKYCF